MPSVTLCLNDTAMSATGLTETEIGTGLTIPAGFNMLRGVRVKYISAAVIDTLVRVPIFRFYSQDLKDHNIEPCQFMGESESSCTTSGNGNQWPSTYFPLNVPVGGSNVIHAYCQLAVTAGQAGVANVQFYLSSEGPRSWAPPLGSTQVHYKMATTLTPPTTVVTAAALNTSANIIQLTQASYVTAIYGTVWQTTQAAGTGCSGKFRLTSPDWQIPFSPEFMNEGGQGVLSAGNTSFAHLTKVGHDLSDDPDFYIPVNKQIANLTPVFVNGPTNIVGAYMMGVQYI